MKRLIKRLLNFALKRISKENQIVSHELGKDSLLMTLIGVLKKSGFTPSLIVDIGANRGTWSRLWKREFPKAKFILIEPQFWLKEYLHDLLDDKAIFLPIGVGSKDGSFKFTINSDRDDSSTFACTDDEAMLLGFKQIDVPVKTINTIIAEAGHHIPDIVKIDAEGLDLEVLDGASKLIGKTEIFLVEASINSRFKNTEIATVINYMDNLGYRVFDITDLNRPFENRVLWLIELVFVRKNGFFTCKEWV